MNILENFIEKENKEEALKDKTSTFLNLNTMEDMNNEISALFDFFAEHEELKAVRVVVNGEHRGIIKREAILSYIVQSEKSVGIGDGAFLMGNSKVAYLTLKCPKSGCDRKVILTYYDKNKPPMCPVHTDTPMEE